MAMTFKGAGGDEPSADMNITPLIDVMLVLLTILIITLPMQTHAVKLDLNGGDRPPAPPPVIEAVDVEFDGPVLWNGTPVDRAALDADLARAARSNPQPEIHLTSDRLAHYDATAKVLADAQRLGVKKIGIIGTENDLH